MILPPRGGFEIVRFSNQATSQRRESPGGGPEAGRALSCSYSPGAVATTQESVKSKLKGY